jgi:hypothetical protein
MLRFARAFVIATLISATPCGIANAAHIAALDVIQTGTSKFTRVNWYHRHYWRGSHPYYSGWRPCLDYWWTWACGGGWWYPRPILRQID